MNDSTIATSVAACGDAMGPRAAGHLDLAFREMTRDRGGEIAPRYLRWITHEAHPMGNLVIAADEGDPQSMREAVAPLASGSFPSMVLMPNGISGEAAQSLRDAGFVDAGAMPAMAVDIARLPPTALPTGYTFRRIGADAASDAWAEALAVGYGLPLTLGRRFSPREVGADMAHDARIQYFLIERGGDVAATSMLFLAGGLAGIYCVATREEHRKRGLGAHLTAEPLRIAGALGYRVGVLQSTAAGHPVYLGLGFADFAAIPMFARMPQ
jgi:GNAT superfamily N-acetyltransferase